MPELPEVETVRRGLQRLIVGKKVARVTYDTPKSFPNAASDVSEFLIGATILGTRRRAKVLLIDLDTNYTLVIHLKMTGQMVFVGHKNQVVSSQSSVNSDKKLSPENRILGTNEPEIRFGAGHPNDSLINNLPDKSTRVIFEFEDEEDGRVDGSRLFFNDQRKFGWVKLYPTIEVPNIDFMKRVGPEPLEDSFTSPDFIQRIRRRAGTTIKAAILDQTVLAGVGNIYADESLWAARIHPAVRVRDVSDEQLNELLIHIKATMTLSIEKGGSTDKNYVDAEGKRGSYLQFANVFRREGQACPRHPDVTIEKLRVAGRGTHICPVCQVIIET